MSSYKIYDNINLYFITSTIVEWYPVFTKRFYFDIIIESLSYCRSEKYLQIHAYVIMLNHIHLVVSLEKGVSKELSNIMRDFKQYTSRSITTGLEDENNYKALNVFKAAAIKASRGNNYKVWKDGFYPKAIYDERFGNQKIEYIHNNPVTKGYVLKPEHWYYSSAGYYNGLKNIPMNIDNVFELNN